MATCLYKPKPCQTCKKTIEVGEQCEYVPETKGVRHWSCSQPESEAPGPEAFRLADKLGYIPYAESLSVAWSAMFFLQGESGIDAARGTGETRGLFD